MKPLKIEEDPKELAALFCHDNFREDYRVLNREIRALGYNIPPLVNAYMNLSPTMKLFGTAINYGFGDVEETGILIAVDEILEEKRVRHIDSFIKEHPEAMKITSGAGKVIYTKGYGRACCLFYLTVLKSNSMFFCFAAPIIRNRSISAQMPQPPPVSSFPIPMPVSPR